MMQSFQKYVKQLVLPSAQGLFTRTLPTEGLVVHATAGDWADGTIGWWRRLLLANQTVFLYQYLIDRGTTNTTQNIWRIGDPSTQFTHHCGASAWDGKRTTRSLNARTEGIALANDNGSDGDMRDDDLTDFQRDALVWLCVVRGRRIGLDPRTRLASHGEVSPWRKNDPLPRILDMNWLRNEVARLL